jgi:hypothetical protein
MRSAPGDLVDGAGYCVVAGETAVAPATEITLMSEGSSSLIRRRNVSGGRPPGVKCAPVRAWTPASVRPNLKLDGHQRLPRRSMQFALHRARVLLVVFASRCTSSPRLDDQLGYRMRY